MSRMIEDAWIDTLQSPGMKERRPVDELAQRLERKVVEHADTGKRWHRYIFCAPRDGRPPLTRNRERDSRILGRRMRFAERCVFGRMLRHKSGLAVVAE